MKKRLNVRLFSSFILLMNVTTAAMASNSFCGPYFGVSAGSSILSGHQDSLHQFRDLTIPALAFSVPNRMGVRKNSLMGAAYLGYAHNWCDYYLGTELFVDVANRDDTNYQDYLTSAGFNVYNISSKVKVDPVSCGLDFRPGYKVTDSFLLYARVGVGISRISMSSEVVTTNGFVSTVLANSVTKSVTRPVLRLGLGLEQELCENLNLRVDYIYTHLGRFLVTGDSTVVTPRFSEIIPPQTLNLSTTSKVNLVNHGIMLGLSWYY